MSKTKGILLDENGDLKIKPIRGANGLILSGFEIGDVTFQNQQTILIAEKGEIKEVPTIGVGLQSFLDDDNTSDLLREIRLNLAADGQKVAFCGFNETGKLVIKAEYES